MSPCSDCPWRRDAIKGWLGDAKIEEWLQCAHGEVTIPCHVHLGVQCAGSAVYRTNVGKSPRDPDILRLPVDRDLVFATPLEFRGHHDRSDGASDPVKHSSEHVQCDVPNHLLGVSVMSKSTKSTKEVVAAVNERHLKKMASLEAKGERNLAKIMAAIKKFSEIMASITAILSMTGLSDAQKLRKIEAASGKATKSLAKFADK